MAALENLLNAPATVAYSTVTTAGQVFLNGGVFYIRLASGYDAVNLNTFLVEALSPSILVVLVEAAIDEV